MNITVYLGANKGIDSSLTMAVRELGEWIGQNGNTLIYGGSRTGLMGEILRSNNFTPSSASKRFRDFVRAGWEI